MRRSDSAAKEQPEPLGCLFSTLELYSGSLWWGLSSRISCRLCSAALGSRSPAKNSWLRMIRVRRDICCITWVSSPTGTLTVFGPACSSAHQSSRYTGNGRREQQTSAGPASSQGSFLTPRLNLPRCNVLASQVRRYLFVWDRATALEDFQHDLGEPQTKINFAAELPKQFVFENGT